VASTWVSPLPVSGREFPAECLILFPLYKLNFISTHLAANKRNCTLSNMLAAVGEKGETALQDAARVGFGKLFRCVSR
jgi:hypothetical protein